MATIDVGMPAISNHLANVFGIGELKEETTISKMETVQQFEKHLCKGETFQGFSFRVNLGNFIALGELKEDAVCAKFAHTTSGGRQSLKIC